MNTSLPTLASQALNAKMATNNVTLSITAHSTKLNTFAAAAGKYGRLDKDFIFTTNAILDKLEPRLSSKTNQVPAR